MDINQLTTDLYKRVKNASVPWQQVSLTPEEFLSLVERIKTYKEVIDHAWCVAAGETQVAMDDTQGMEYLSDYLSSIEDNEEN